MRELYSTRGRSLALHSCNICHIGGDLDNSTSAEHKSVENSRFILFFKTNMKTKQSRRKQIARFELMIVHYYLILIV